LPKSLNIKTLPQKPEKINKLKAENKLYSEINITIPKEKSIDININNEHESTKKYLNEELNMNKTLNIKKEFDNINRSNIDDINKDSLKLIDANNYLPNNNQTSFEVDNINEIFKNKNIIYLIKSSKKKNNIENDKIIYIKKDELKENEEIIYSEIKYEEKKHKQFKKSIYLEEKDFSLYSSKRIIYLIKYERQNIENEKIIYVILEDENNNKRIEHKIDNSPSYEIDKIIENKKIIYLIKSDKNKKDIDEKRTIYIIKDEKELNEIIEEKIYIEIKYETIKYKNYKKTIYLKTKNYSQNLNDERIIYLIKYDNNKRSLKNEKIIYIILDDEYENNDIFDIKKEDLNIDEIKKYKEVIYLIKSDKNKKNSENKKYAIKGGNLEIERIFYNEIIYDESKYKDYIKNIYLQTKDIDIDRSVEEQSTIYIEKYDKYIHNIKSEKIIYIILESETKDNIKDNDLIYKNKLIDNKKDSKLEEDNKMINKKKTGYKIQLNGPPHITYFKFFNYKHTHLSSFNISSIIKREKNTTYQNMFFNNMHKRYACFKLFYLYKKFTDPRKKCLNIWSHNY